MSKKYCVTHWLTIVQLIQIFVSGCQDEKFIFGGQNIPDDQASQASTEFICRQKCLGNVECKFWTWSKQNGCNLKDGNALIERVSNESYVSGTPQCPGKSLLLDTSFHIQINHKNAIFLLINGCFIALNLPNRVN